ncbi:hypothetical protein HDV64DRAFT_247145 [Trichoderma sp. TUCIM 5745]
MDRLVLVFGRSRVCEMRTSILVVHPIIIYRGLSIGLVEAVAVNVVCGDWIQIRARQMAVSLASLNQPRDSAYFGFPPFILPGSLTQAGLLQLVYQVWMKAKTTCKVTAQLVTLNLIRGWIKEEMTAEFVHLRTWLREVVSHTGRCESRGVRLVWECQLGYWPTMLNGEDTNKGN